MQTYQLDVLELVLVRGLDVLLGTNVGHVAPVVGAVLLIRSLGGVVDVSPLAFTVEDLGEVGVVVGLGGGVPAHIDGLGRDGGADKGQRGEQRRSLGPESHGDVLEGYEADEEDTQDENELGHPRRTRDESASRGRARGRHAILIAGGRGGSRVPTERFSGLASARGDREQSSTTRMRWDGWTATDN